MEMAFAWAEFEMKKDQFIWLICFVKLGMESFERDDMLSRIIYQHIKMTYFNIIAFFTYFRNSIRIYNKRVTKTATTAKHQNEREGQRWNQTIRGQNILTRFDWLTWSLAIENKTTVRLLWTPICVNSNLRSFRKRFSLYPSLSIISNCSQPVLYRIIIITLQK